MHALIDLLQRRKVASAIVAVFVMMAVAIPGSQLLSQDAPSTPNPEVPPKVVLTEEPISPQDPIIEEAPEATPETPVPQEDPVTEEVPETPVPQEDPVTEEAPEATPETPAPQEDPVTEEVPETPVAQDDPITEEAPEATPTEATLTEEDPVIDSTGPILDDLLEAETFCQMNINDAGDDDPFTYGFEAINTANIVGYAWDFGDTNTATTQNATHTFTAVGDYTITLECTEEAVFGGAVLTLTGQISISNNPVAAFTVNPVSIVGLPATVGTANASTGQGLTYEWKISTSANPNDAGFQNFTTENVVFEFTEAVFAGAGLNPDLLQTIYFHLRVSDSTGVPGAWATAGVGYGPPAPEATFTVDPSTGQAPLVVNVTGIDLDEGPIDTWMWSAPGSVEGTATGQGDPVPHTFTYNNPGTYTITLDFSNAAGGFGQTTKQVGVFEPTDPVQALLSVISMETVPGGIEVCFSNDSTGPVVQSEWDFDYVTANGMQVDTVTGLDQVCNIYNPGGAYTVRLRVQDSTAAPAGPIISTANLPINVVDSPVADFNIIPGDVITWGTDINLQNASTGFLLTYEWDWTGDGVADSTQENPTGISLLTLGANTIRLTVTDDNGLTAFVEKIVMVERLELTCGINGDVAVAAGTGGRTYTSVIGDDGGRAITYEWLITGTGIGLPLTLTTQDINLDWPTIGFGAFQITLTASTADGSECVATTTVNHSHPGLDCQIISDVPAAPIYNDPGLYPFNFAVDVPNLNLNDRTIDSILWSTGATTQTTTFTPPGLGTYTVRYDIVVNNGTGYTPATSTCFEEITFTIEDWPAPTCTGINGQGNPLPSTPDTPGRNYNYQAIVNNLVGRDVEYTWTITDGVINSPNPRTNNNQANVTWNASAIGAPDEGLTFTAVVTNPDGSPGGTCNFDRNDINVRINALDCRVPIGDANPIVGDPEAYNIDVNNIYGRGTTAGFPQWTLTQVTPAGPTITGTGNIFNNTFLVPGTIYELTYEMSVDAAGTAPQTFIPGETCVSPPLTIEVYGAGINFQCESALTGNLNPINPAGTYAYQMDIDNGTNVNLRYTWVLTDSDGTEYILDTIDTDFDGQITSPAFTFAALSPILVDEYNIRVDVAAVDPAASAYTCSRDLDLIVGYINANYTYTAGAWTNNALPVGQEICLTNDFDVERGGIPALDYTWDISGDAAFNSLGGNTFNAQDLPDCFSFSEPGAYTIDLTGVNGSGLMSDTHSVTFNVYGLQSIVIDRTGPNTGPSTQNFTAIGVNITGNYDWDFFDLGGNLVQEVNNNQNPSINLPPGTYTAVVTGDGPLGDTQASLEFTLIGADGLSAGFIPSPFGGIAPLDVCFTDTSISGSPITLWEWDFDNNGIIDQSYDNNNIPAQVCTTYPDPASIYTARLVVHNASGAEEATNIIRTYNLLEISASFAIVPQGGRTFCFVEQNPADVSVTGWNFGDGNGDGAVDQTCHTFAADGTYAVEMSVTNGPLTGIVVRPVVVLLTNGAPIIGVTGTCAADTTATFTVTNTGDAMTTPDQVTIRDNDGNVILIAPLQLGANASTQYQVNGYVGTVTLTAADNITATADTDCVEPPVLSGNATCAIDGMATFTIRNDSFETAASQAYQIVDAGGNVVDTGTINVPTRGITTVSLSGVWGPLTFTSEDANYGPTASLSINSDCATPPLLTAVHTCDIDGTAVFTVSNTSPDTPASQNYTVRDANGLLIDSGVLSVPVNGSQQIRITGNYEQLTLTSSGPQGVTTNINVTGDCNEPPILNVVTSCSTNNTAVFAVFNTSADSTANQTYQVFDANNTVVDSGTLNILPGAQQNIQIPNATGIVTMVSSGPEGPTTEINTSTSCNEAPVLEGAAICAADGNTIFSISNLSPVNAASQPYEVVDSSGTIVDSGTLNVAPSSTTDITVPGNLGPLTFTSTGTEGETTQVTINSNCGEPPVLTATSVCNGDTTTFVITNTGVSPANQPYEVRNQANVLVSTGTLNVAGGSTQEISLTGDFGPLTFTSTGLTTVTASSNCQTPPDINIDANAPITGSVTCAGDGMVNFTITNNGLTDVAQLYTITTPGGEQAGGGMLTIGVGSSVTLTAQTSGTALTFSTGGDAGSLTLTVDGNCAITTYITGEPGTPPPTDGTVPRISTTPPIRTYLPQLDLTPRLDTSVLDRPAWDAIEIGGAVCVDWLVYHTNMTGDWEIFRLGDDEGRLAQFDPNLSQGRGEDVVDMAPTRSPDNEWIAFTSNRDSTLDEENWELYVAKVDNSEIRRVTYNTFAKDIDPAWSPDGRYLVFETDRDGNWELYLLDLMTGAETRLTDNPTNDINAFWAPDSKSVAFQTDRDGMWQVYTIDIATGEETLMSDGSGDDHDPAFSFEGDHILFRSYRDGVNSTIYMMDADGQNVTRLSDPRGNATNHTWSPDDSVIAYQSDLDGDLDIYAYEVEDKETRLVTDNNIHDYAPTWYCDAPLIVFTSDVVGDPNIFNTPALPIEAPAILVDREASQMTFDPADDVYPENNPAEENASREGNVPPHIGVE